MGNGSLDWIIRCGGALLAILTQPLFYVGIGFSVLLVRRQIVLERKLFHVKLHALLAETWRTLAWGIGGGLAVSLLMAAIGVSLTVGGVLWLWGIALLLMLFRVRFLCLAYSVGVLGLLQQAVLLLPSSAEGPSIASCLDPLRTLNVPSLLVLVALLHLLEAVLIRFQGSRMSGAMFYEGKRGKIVGGYQLQGFWTVPLALLVPVSGGGFDLPWSPLLGHFLDNSSWSWLGFPVMIGFSDWTTTRLPGAKLRGSAARLTGYAVVLLAGSVAALYLPTLTVSIAILAIALHELLLWWSRLEETRRSPYFVHDTQGLRILAVVPGSAAEEMGLQAGEQIHKANQVRVTSKEQLHAALRMNSAFCRLEVLNLEGHSKYVSRAMFAGEHHQLGIVLCPDEQAGWYLAEVGKETPFFTVLRRKWFGLAASSGRGSGEGKEIEG